MSTSLSVRAVQEAAGDGGRRPPPVQDHLAILDLLARYCLCLDLHDIDGWVSLFTENGRYEVYGRTFNGHEGLRRMMAAAPRGLHLGGVPVVEVIGEGQARSTQNLYFVPTSGEAPRSSFYTDELVRTDTGWRLASRRCQFQTSEGFSDRPPG